MPDRSDPTNLPTAQCCALLQGVEDGLVATEVDGTVVYLNDAATHLYGFAERSGEQLERLNLQRYALDTFEVRTPGGELVPDDDRPLVRALRGEAYQDVQLLVRHRDESDPKVFAFSGSRIEGDPPVGVLTIRDETERWRSERRYRVAFETDPAPTALARLRDATLLDVNAGFAEMTGSARDDLIGADLADLAMLSEGDGLQESLTMLERGERIHKAKTELAFHGRGEVSVLLSARAIEIEGEACAIFTFIDLTDLEASQRQQRLQKELARARSRLAVLREQERLHLGRDLHDGVLQDLLALNTLQGMDERRLRKRGDPAAAGMIARHRESVLKSATVLRNTIQILRPGTLKELGLWDALRELTDEAPWPSGVELVLPGDSVPATLSDEALLTLHRVAQEAIRNAAKHAHPSRIEVSLEVGGEEAVLRVQDDGKGFEVPERLAELAEEDHFGLIGMEERAAANGGTLEVASASGDGTQVTCRLPIGERSGGTTPTRPDRVGA